MSHARPTYSFLPWLRQGVANHISAADGDPAVTLRAALRVQLELSGDKVDGSGTVTRPVTRDVALFGPGDVVGIERRAIIRCEPRDFITSFEPNYLPFVEFYDEDFPWRYTPAAPGSGPGPERHRLRPWIALVVLKEDEFQEGKNVKDRPLPYIAVSDADRFPPADEMWAWAHVHLNRSLGAEAEPPITSEDLAAVLPRLDAALSADPDVGYSRLFCPRRLEDNTAYHAFLVPVFESGRLAGLGLDPAAAPHATSSAWAPYPPAALKAEPQHHPVYHRWYFRTGTVGDFEYLVRLLQPKPVDKTVGRRDLDVQHPGANLPGILDPALGGVLKLGGALRAPLDSLSETDRQEVEKYERWAEPRPHQFQQHLAALVNLADDYAALAAQQANQATQLPGIADDPDPLVVPPIYGRWHALTARLLRARDGGPVQADDNWVHELNLDPRHRAAAGFGTRVVQQQQEDLMNAAWEQIGQVLEANRRIRGALLARAVSARWHARHLEPLRLRNPERAVGLTAPVHKRALVAGATVHHRLARSPVPPAVLSLPARQALRPRGRVGKTLVWDQRARPTNLLARMNAGEVTATPPKVVPAGVTTVQDAVKAALPGLPAWLVAALRRVPFARFLPFALVVLLVLVALAGGGAVAWLLAVAAAGGAIPAYTALARWQRAVALADALLPQNQTPEAVDRLPRSPDFVLSEPGGTVTPRAGLTDSAQARTFKAALKRSNALLQASGQVAAVAPRPPVDLPALATTMVTAVDPHRTVPRRTLSSLGLPDHLQTQLGEQLEEVMNYPEIDVPMYKPLVDLSPELFLPNINRIEPNSITLLETNQKFIEAYMVGLNHELSRELLWREYPTDQRGSSLRQFWDPSSFLGDVGDPTLPALREKLRDIPPLHRWERTSRLGDHDHRETGGASDEEVVLAIRGELLKKYPTAVIYAHRAAWEMTADGHIDRAQPRRMVPLTPAEEDNPPRDKVKTPSYEAKVDPDIYFFGFDLNIREARGGSGSNDSDEAGWFFVIKERPGEPRFGLDIDRAAQLNTWNDLAWPDVLPEGAGPYLRRAGTPSLTLVEPVGPGSEAEHEQWQDDRQVTLNADASAADLAYILFQAPVLVAVHAAEMLPRETT